MSTRYVPPLRQSDGARHYLVSYSDDSQQVLCNACAHRAIMVDGRLVRATLLAPQAQLQRCERCRPPNVVALFGQG